MNDNKKVNYLVSIGEVQQPEFPILISAVFFRIYLHLKKTS